MSGLKFNQTENGKLIHYVIHEHGNGMSTIDMALENLKLKHKKGYDLELEKFFEVVKAGIKRSNDAIDYLYTKSKNDFEASSYQFGN